MTLSERVSPYSQGLRKTLVTHPHATLYARAHTYPIWRPPANKTYHVPGGIFSHGPTDTCSSTRNILGTRLDHRIYFRLHMHSYRLFIMTFSTRMSFEILSEVYAPQYRVCIYYSCICYRPFRVVCSRYKHESTDSSTANFSFGSP